MNERESVFCKLINAVKSPPILALPKNGLLYSVDTDVFVYQVGAALFQIDEEDNRRPIGFWSRTLNKHGKITQYVRRNDSQLCAH